MNKKIYYNDNWIEFGERSVQDSQNQELIVLKELSYSTLSDFTEVFLSQEKNTKSKKSIIFLTKEENFELVLDYLTKHYHYIIAAGGLIRKENSFLFIKRLGKWDLPKGKLDKGEKIEECAVRECEEECAVRGLMIRSELPSTFHLYQYKNSFALKRTYWYEMETTFSGVLKPQTEENIEEVKWFEKKEIEKIVLKNTYFTISDLLHSYFKFH